MKQTFMFFMSILNVKNMHVTGIGGVFLKAKDPKAMAAWYEEYLGVAFAGQTYVSMKWINENNPAVPGATVFSFFPQDTKYFDPGRQECMINFRVMDLDGLLNKLKSAGIWVDDKVQDYGYGRFGYCMDPEGNKIELWEPIDN